MSFGGACVSYGVTRYALLCVLCVIALLIEVFVWFVCDVSCGDVWFVLFALGVVCEFVCCVV